MMCVTIGTGIGCGVVLGGRTNASAEFETIDDEDFLA